MGVQSPKVSSQFNRQNGQHRQRHQRDQSPPHYKPNLNKNASEIPHYRPQNNSNVQQLNNQQNVNDYEQQQQQELPPQAANNMNNGNGNNNGNDLLGNVDSRRAPVNISNYDNGSGHRGLPSDAARQEKQLEKEEFNVGDDDGW